MRVAEVVGVVCFNTLSRYVRGKTAVRAACLPKACRETSNVALERRENVHSVGSRSSETEKN
jgi:hypothetical protein